MSYSGYVICNCYMDGLTVDPPYKEFVRFDEDGLYLMVPEDIWEKNTEQALRMEAEFDDWKFTACEHEEMELAHEYLSNIIGMGSFRHVVNELGGKDRFPILSTYLPTVNGGILAAEFAKQLFGELTELENEQSGFAYVIEPLKRLAKASMVSGNPIHWC